MPFLVETCSIPTSAVQQTPSVSAKKTTNASDQSTNNASSRRPKTTLGKTGSDDHPIDMEYYDLLEIPATASSAVIKKAYYLKAIKCHPDKNLDNPLAEEMFKQISEAYQVLSDPQRRSFYNIHGKAAAVGSEGFVFVDPEQFFRQQFGGDMFVDIIGEISIARDFKDVMAAKDPSKSNNLTTDSNSSTINSGTEVPSTDATTQAKQDSALMYEQRRLIRKERIQKLSHNLVVMTQLGTNQVKFDPETPTKTINPTTELSAR